MNVGRVLLLNATFEPLQLVSERRAVVLMLAGRAEPIAMPDEPMVCRSSSIVIEIPAIVRLARHGEATDQNPNAAAHASLVAAS